MEVIGHAVSMCEAVKEKLSPASCAVWDAGGLCGGATFPHMVQKLFTHSHCFQNKIQSSIKRPSRFPLSWSLLPSLPALLPCTSFPCQALCDKSHLQLPSVPCLVISPLCSVPVVSLFRSQLKHHLLRDPLSSATCSVKYQNVCFPPWT